MTAAGRRTMLAPKRLPSGSRKTSEFKRYQQALAAVYIGTIGAGALLLAASVIEGLFFRPVVHPSGPMLSSDDPDPREMLRCHEDVTRLYAELDHTAAELLALPPRDRASELVPTWDSFSRGWLVRWEEANGRCRFFELADTHMGEAYDLMANAHGALLAIRLKYQSLLVQFDREQAAELADMHRALDRSRRLLAGGARAQGTNSEGAP